MHNRLKPSLFLAATALLGACASQEGFPSLAPRAVERELSGNPPPPCLPPGSAAPAPTPGAPAAVAVAVADDPELGARIAALLAEARRGERAFSALLARAQASARRAGAAGSEAWIAAQQDVSRLEAARAPTVDALTELDRLALARSDAAISEADRNRLVAAAEEVRRLAEAQREQLDRLNGTLSAR